MSKAAEGKKEIMYSRISGANKNTCVVPSTLLYFSGPRLTPRLNLLGVGETITAHSSSGPGRWPLTPETGVRLPYAPPI